MATYTVTNSFSADTTAIASEVNQNFTDVLTALNAFDASNLSSGTIPLARISGLTTTQISAATLVIESEGIESNDNDTTWPSCAAVKDAYDTAIAADVVTLSAYTNLDSDNNALTRDHAYLAGSAGSVSATLDTDAGIYYLRGYVGTTNDPVGAGDLIQHQSQGIGAPAADFSITFDVAEGEYFEITTTGNTPVVWWKSFGTLSKPVDQD